MSKTQKTNREAKKPAATSLKEKRAAKKLKEDVRPPLLLPQTRGK